MTIFIPRKKEFSLTQSSLGGDVRLDWSGEILSQCDYAMANFGTPTLYTREGAVALTEDGTPLQQQYLAGLGVSGDGATSSVASRFYAAFSASMNKELTFYTVYIPANVTDVERAITCVNNSATDTSMNGTIRKGFGQNGSDIQFYHRRSVRYTATGVLSAGVPVVIAQRGAGRSYGYINGVLAGTYSNDSYVASKINFGGGYTGSGLGTNLITLVARGTHSELEVQRISALLLDNPYQILKPRKSYFMLPSAATGSSAALTGTATSSITESDIVITGKTIILELTADTWVAAGATFDAVRQPIINGLTAAQTETLGWNNEVRDKEVVTSVVRTSDTVVTITLTAGAAYDITAQETITATIPATALVTSASAVVAVPTFTVDFATGATTISAQLEQISLQSLLSNSQLNKTVTASFATLSQTTSPVIVTLSKSISTLSENIDVIPQLSSIALSKFILPSTESLSVSTLSAATSLSTTVHATTAQITLSELVSSISRTKSISASASYIELTTNPSVAEVSRVIDATTHSVDLSSNSCSILLSSDIPSNLESILLSHLGSQVALNSEIDSLIESVTLSTNGVTIVLDTNVTATIPSAILSAHSVIVTKGIVVPNTAGLAFDSLSRKLHLSGRSRKFHFSGNDTLSLTFK